MKLPVEVTQIMKMILRPYDEDTWYQDDTEEAIKEAGFEIFLTSGRGFYAKDDDIVLAENRAITFRIPQDVSEQDLVLKAIATLQDKIKEEHAISERRCMKFQEKINGLTLLEHMD